MTRIQTRRAAVARAARMDRIIGAVTVAPFVALIVGLIVLVVIGGALAPLVNGGALAFGTFTLILGTATVLGTIPAAWAFGADA